MSDVDPTPAATAVELLTVAEVAAMLRVSKMTIYRLVDSGALQSMRVGRSVRLPRSSVDSYLRSAREANVRPDA